MLWERIGGWALGAPLCALGLHLSGLGVHLCVEPAMGRNLWAACLLWECICVVWGAQSACSGNASVRSARASVCSGTASVCSGGGICVFWECICVRWGSIFVLRLCVNLLCGVLWRYNEKRRGRVFLCNLNCTPEGTQAQMRRRHEL